jgi:hypothetical protein
MTRRSQGFAALTLLAAASLPVATAFVAPPPAWRLSNSGLTLLTPWHRRLPARSCRRDPGRCCLRDRAEKEMEADNKKRYFGAGGAMDKRLPKVEAVVTGCRDAAALVLIDGDNVRAAFGWRMSPEALLLAVDAWAGASGFAGKVLLTYDHGDKAESFIGSNTAVQVSGPRQQQEQILKSLFYSGFLSACTGALTFEHLRLQSADDALAQAAAFLSALEGRQNSTDVRVPSASLLLISSDHNLAARLRLQMPPEHVCVCQRESESVRARARARDGEREREREREREKERKKESTKERTCVCARARACACVFLTLSLYHDRKRG